MTFNKNNKRPKFDSARVMGLHAIIECRGSISQFNCVELESLMRQMAEAAGATVLAANFHDFGSGLGNTGVLTLAESHITVHSWPEHDYAALDMFVCGDACNEKLEPVEAAIDVLRSTDRHGCLSYQILERGTPHNSKVGILETRTGVNLSRKFVNEVSSSLGRQNADD